jgi:hypothetical protein
VGLLLAMAEMVFDGVGADSGGPAAVVVWGAVAEAVLGGGLPEFGVGGLEGVFPGDVGVAGLFSGDLA